MRRRSRTDGFAELRTEGILLVRRFRKESEKADGCLGCVADNIVWWRHFFPKGSLRHTVELPIRAVLAWVGAGGKKGDVRLYRQIMAVLSDIAEASEPTCRELEIQDVWRKTFDLVSEQVAVFESRTAAIRSEISSAKSEEAERRTLQRMETHQTAMRRIKNFFLAYPRATGEVREWGDIWNRISGESQDANEATFPRESDRLSNSPYVSSTYTVPKCNKSLPPIAEGELDEGDIVCKCDESAGIRRRH